VLSRISQPNNIDQTLFVNTPISDIIFKIGGNATGAEVSGLPPGVESYKNGDTIIISGTPSQVDTFYYTITTTGTDPECNEASISGTIVVNQTVSVYDPNIEGFRLYQNRPNPFRSETTFGFEIPQAANVTFKIFDSSGKLVESISNDYNYGYNELRISVNFPSGFYLYEIITPFGALRNRMLIK
jgi:hypothetical protein